MSDLYTRWRGPAGYGGLILAVGLGLLHGVSQHQEASAQRRSEAAESDATDEDAAGSDELQGASAGASPTSDASAVAPPVPTAPVDLTRARDALDRADREYQATKYEAARHDYAEALQYSAGGVSGEASAVALLARSGSARAKLLTGLSSAVKPSPFLGREDLFEVELFTGRTYVVRFLEDSATRVRLEFEGGVPLEFKPDAVVDRSPCPPEKWTTKVRAQLVQFETDIERDNPFDLYRTAYFCLRNGLRDEGHRFLEQAMSHDTAGLLAATFCASDHRPSPLERDLIYGREAATVAWSGPSLDAEPAPDAGPGTAGGSEPASTPAASTGTGLGSDEDYVAAMRTLQTALTHYRRSYFADSVREAQKELGTAEALFRDARDLLDNVKARRGADAEIDQRLREIQQFLTDCAKATRLSRD